MLPVTQEASMNGDEELTDLQKAFCREYPLDWNATKATIRAGYSENGASVTGSQLLANPKIRAEIDRAIDLELGVKRSVIRSRVINELEKLGYNDEADDEGRPLVRTNDKIKALELLGKYGCLFTEKVEITGKDGEPINNGITVSFVKPKENNAN